MRNARCVWLVVLAMAGVVQSGFAVGYRLADVAVVAGPAAPEMTRLAADQVRAYAWRLTGTYPAVGEAAPAGRPAIVLRTGDGSKLSQGGPDPAQNFALYREQDQQIVHGRSARATLWAAYALIESWGVGFYLGGDALPPRRADFIAEYQEASFQPAMAVRGSVPWFNFLNSPTTWNPQDYKTFFQQMAKQRANLVHFHAYDHEPMCGFDIKDDKVEMGGPLMTTISAERWWSPHAMCTKDFLFGTGLFFSRGEWGSEVGIDDGWTFAPGRATRWQQQMVAEALRYARSLGIETCLGFEVTGDPLDQVNQEKLEKRIRHVLATYPLDYLSIWQSESKGISGEEGNREQDHGSDADELWRAFSYFPEMKQQAEGVRMARYNRQAYAILKAVRPDVKMVVSGWGGDQHMKFTDYYVGLDKVLPKDVVFSALDNMNPRRADHASEAYGKLGPGRARWPVPWFETDGGELTGPQPNVGAFEPVLKDIARKKCEGLLGIHWRTRNVEDVAGYLYRFGWNVQLTPAEFLQQYARDQYGPGNAERMTQVHLKLEEYGAQYVGVSGTPECAPKRFLWFTKKKNLNRARLPDLAALAKDLRGRSADAAAKGQGHAALRFHDLAATIDWLVKRAYVGTAIWGNEAPLLVRLEEAENLCDQGRVSESRARARLILTELEALNFRGALEALATTCRTRGELGVLATVNARYGRYYATFVQRLARILGKPLPEAFGRDRWRGEEVFIVYPVPDQVSADEAVSFDAVLLPQSEGAVSSIALTRLTGSGDETVTLPMERLNGAYYRAVFFPPGAGTWAWRLIPDDGHQRSRDALPLPEGIVTIRSLPPSN